MFDAMTDADDFGLRYHKAMLRIFGGISVLGNVAYGFVSEAGTLPSVFTALVSAIFPLTLMAASDDLVVLARHCTGAVRAAMMAMAAATAVLMFVVSFDALSGLFMLAGKGAAVAKCGAIAIDLFVVQASISALWASNKVRAAEESRTTQGRHPSDHVDDGTVDAEPAHPAGDGPAQLDDPAHEQAAHPVHGLAHEQVDEVPAQPVTEPAHPVHDVPAQPVEGLPRQAAQGEPAALSPQVNGHAHSAASKLDDGSVSEPAHPADDKPAQLDDPAHEQAAHPVHDLAHEQVDDAPAHPVHEHPAHPAQDAGGVDHAALAAYLIAERGVDADAPIVAEVLALRAEDTAWSRIAEAAGKSTSTVRRWVDGAAELDAAYAASVGKRPKAVLAVVGD